jgi:glycosyltransferase involved in cell wall biosynthesis
MVSGIASLLLRRRPIFVGTEHSHFSDINHKTDRSSVEYLLYKLLARVGYRKLDHVVAVSNGVRDRIIEDRLVKAQRVSVIPTPFTPPIPATDLQRALTEYIHGEKIILLSVGRLDPLKDYPTLLRAVRRLVDQKYTVELNILGDGQEREKLESLVRQLGLQEVVKFRGNVLNPRDWYLACDVFILTSLREGFGLVLVEALYYGCRIVSTDCPSGPREILGEGRFGQLVSVGDDAAVCDAVIRALDEQPNLNALRGRSLDFSQDVVAKKFARLYEHLLDDVRSRNSATIPRKKTHLQSSFDSKEPNPH